MFYVIVCILFYLFLSHCLFFSVIWTLLPEINVMMMMMLPFLCNGTTLTILSECGTWLELNDKLNIYDRGSTTARKVTLMIPAKYYTKFLPYNTFVTTHEYRVHVAQRR